MRTDCGQSATATSDASVPAKEPKPEFNFGSQIEDAVVRAVIQDDDGIKLQADVVGLDLTALMYTGRLSSQTGPGPATNLDRAPKRLRFAYTEIPVKSTSRPSTPIPQTSSSVPGSGAGTGNVATPTIYPSSLMPFATVDVAPGTLNVVK